MVACQKIGEYLRPAYARRKMASKAHAGSIPKRETSQPKLGDAKTTSISAIKALASGIGISRCGERTCALASCAPRGRKSARNILMRNGRLSRQSGEIYKPINVIPRILIPPFPGSNPGAPAKFLRYFHCLNRSVVALLSSFRKRFRVSFRNSVPAAFARRCVWRFRVADRARSIVRLAYPA